jgi:hypothetical protein
LAFSSPFLYARIWGILMDRHVVAALAAFSALFAILGSLFLAYDYLDTHAGGRRNPLRQILRYLVPTLTGTFPGILLALVLGSTHVSDVQVNNVAVTVIALGAVAGLLNAHYMSAHDEGETEAQAKTERKPTRPQRTYFHGLLGRAGVGFLLGSLITIVLALATGSSVDNALTIAGSSGPITMILLSVWPLIRWTPSTSVAQSETPGWRGLPYAMGLIGLVGVLVGATDGLFDARVPQRAYSCLTESHGCAQWSDVNVGGTVLIHTTLFFVGAIGALLIWLMYSRGLQWIWDSVLARSPFSSRVFGMLLTGGMLGFMAAGVLEFAREGSPGSPAFSLQWVGITVLLGLAGGVCGALVPLQSVRDSLRQRFPFSRYDALVMAGFAVIVLVSFITLTNLSNLGAAELGLPRGAGETPIQLTRIAYFTRAAFFLGLPVALAVGGLTRAAYRWAEQIPQRVLGAVGIGLSLLAFILQLVDPLSVLLSP